MFEVIVLTNIVVMFAHIGWRVLKAQLTQKEPSQAQYSILGIHIVFTGVLSMLALILMMGS